MQGNKLDDQFIDRAWVEMQKLLDEQMPVAIPSGNKKRLAFLWLFLLLGLISGSLGLGLWWNKSASPAPAAGKEKNQPAALDKALPVTGGEKVNTHDQSHSQTNNRQ